MFITYTAPFDLLNNQFAGMGSGDPDALYKFMSASFVVWSDGSNTLYNGNLLNLFMEVGGVKNAFITFLPAMLTWIVCGLLAGLFSQSAKKGIISAIVFVIVEILLYLLMRVITGADLITDVFMPGGDIVEGLVVTFLGNIVLTPVAFGIVGGAVGGLLSQFIFGPEEI
ncbi:MAG: hypothetical protein ACTSVI_15290 [Promethearchaeota archaeon]